MLRERDCVYASYVPQMRRRKFISPGLQSADESDGEGLRLPLRLPQHRFDSDLSLTDSAMWRMERSISSLVLKVERNGINILIHLINAA